MKCLRCGRFGHHWLMDVECPFYEGPTPDETCPNGCERYGDWWVPEDCASHLGVA